MRICLLGSTGSIGCNMLEVVTDSNSFKVTTLAAATNIEKLLEQNEQFKPDNIIFATQEGYDKYTKMTKSQHAPNMLIGEEGIQSAVTSSDLVVNALSGTNGLLASILAIKAGKKLLLANKESLVAGGDLIIKLSKEHSSDIISLDSEHNAIMRCLPREYTIGESIHDYGVKRLWLTASGGPFLKQSLEAMENATAADACKHPIWSMGSKISIDSATMMNKGLEVIEACHLFNLKQENVKVVIHPQSIVHCLVEYDDGSMIAQLSKPDMKITIHQALYHPEYIPLQQEPLDPLTMGNLEFSEPELDKFPCIELAKKANLNGGVTPMALSIADDQAVEAFLQDRISFTDIATVIQQVTNIYSNEKQQKFPDNLTEIKQLSKEMTTDSNRLIKAL